MADKSTFGQAQDWTKFALDHSGGVLGVDPDPMGEMDPERRQQATDAYRRSVDRFQDASGRHITDAGQRLAALQGRPGIIDINRGGPMAGQQQDFASLLAARASGQMASPAEAAQQRMTQQNMAAAMAASHQGQHAMTPGAQRRMMLQGVNQAQNAGNRDLAALRIQEQDRARNMLGGVLQGARGQSLQGAQQNLDVQMGNLSAQEQQDNMSKYYMDQSLDAKTEALGARGDIANMYADQYRDIEQARYEAEVAKAGANKGLVGGMLGFLSDKRLKKKIKKADKDMDAFLGALKAQKWEYKDKRHGEGDYTGFMAQDAEKTAVGREMIIETPEGKAVDMKRATMAALAGLARIDKRLKKVGA